MYSRADDVSSHHDTAGVMSVANPAAAAAASWAEGLGGGTGDDPGLPGRQTCWAVWHEDLAVFEVLQPRGDSLRSLVSDYECFEACR